MSDLDTIRLDLPATHKYLNVLGACITEILARVEGLSEPNVTAYNIQLAVHEACTNVVEHAYAGQTNGRITIMLQLTAEPRALVVDLYDTGTSFDIASAREPDLQNAQVHGYGLFLIRNLMDEMTYTTHPGQNHWHFIKYL